MVNCQWSIVNCQREVQQVNHPVALSLRHLVTLSRTLLVSLSTCFLVLLLAACGGPAMTTPTPIPASVARPQQPTPVYAADASRFSLATPMGTPQIVPTNVSAASIAGPATGAGGARAAIRLFIENQTPSAVGIATGGATIFATRGGSAVAGVPVGGVVTVTGKSADENWYAVYDNKYAYGWIPAGQLRVYGGDDLIVIDEALDPAPIATLLAQTARPMQVLDDLMVTMEARSATTEAKLAAVTATPAPAAPPTATPTLADPGEAPAALPSPTAAVVIAAETAAITGSIISDGRLNVRTTPDTAAAIVLKLDPDDVVEVTGRNAAGDWLRVALDDGSTGWVAAEFVELSAPADALPVEETEG
jgi:hypothetical protein